MRTFIIAAALAMIAFAGIAQAQHNCTQTCTPTFGGGYSCTTYCW